jgi:site-specific recombinase XerD
VSATSVDRAPEAPGGLTLLVEQARDYADRATAPSTRRAYRTDWADFAAWCDRQRLPALPAAPETVALYLADLAQGGKSASTLRRRLAAIAAAHRLAGHDSPTRHATVRTVWSGIRRAHGTAQVGKTPALTADLRAMVHALPDTVSGARDRALLLLGFAGAFRRSELVALDVADLQAVPEGFVVTIRTSKTDQEGAGRKIGIPHGRHAATCPVAAVQSWRELAGIAEGAVFRGVDRHGNVGDTRLSDRAVALVVKRAAAAAGLDPAQYAGHSLRAGLATSAAQAGVSERAIADQTGHRSLVILRRYIREGSLFRENAAAGVGL